MVLTDEYANYTFDFRIAPDDYKQFGESISLTLDDFKLLTSITEKVRKSQGSQEEILQALLKLSSSSYSYQQFLYETTITGGCKENG